MRLVCHCTQTQSCHADALIRRFRELYPDAYDRNDPTQRAPTADELNLLARHRQEPPSDEGSSADDGVPKKNSGWIGVGAPFQVGVGHTSRDHCDGQGLASPGRWPIEGRRYPRSLIKVTTKFTLFAEARSLGTSRVEVTPFVWVWFVGPDNWASRSAELNG